MSTILVIDDDELFRGLLKAAFEKTGYHVLVSEDGEHGVETAKEHVPDVIVTDMSMPRMTGWDVLDALNQDARTENIPAVVLSAHRTSQDMDEAYARGCAGYMVKPVPLPDLLAKVKEILDR